MLLKLVLAYEGTNFSGWARQPGRRTVEQTLTEALECIYRELGPLAVAGRTDAGVHALANVASVEVAGGPPPAQALRALNAVLPPDLAVVEAAEAPAGFHARFSAVSRSYRYRIWRSPVRSPFEARRALWYPRPLDLQRLGTSASLLLGEHDFRAFTPTDSQHDAFRRCVLAAAWVERGEALEFEITADSFLRHMVRTLVGTMLERSPDQIAPLLLGAPRAAAGATAPARGLRLLGVGYERGGATAAGDGAAPG
jgi:tRNA pseudouridine38-40 synthase